MYLVFYKYGEDLKPHFLGAYNSYTEARNSAIVSASFKTDTATFKIISVVIDLDYEDSPWKDKKELVWEGRD